VKVLLISANTVTEPYPVYPLGLDYVAGALMPKHRVRILDLNANDSPTALSDAIGEFEPDMIGVSLRNIDTTDITHPKGFVPEYRKLVERIRTLSKAAIALGGSGFTLFPEEMMTSLGADYGIVGEGERFADLLEALEANHDPTSIPGVVTQGNATGFRSLTSTLGPKQPSRFFDPTAPHLRYYLLNGGMLNLQTKRGCPFRCVYCTYPHIEGRRMRLLPPEEVARTALDLEAAGAKYIFITDSAFNADPGHSLEVAKMFKKMGLSIPWGGFFAPMGIDPDYFMEMADAGLTHVEFGTESMDAGVLKAYGKPFAPADVFKSHASALAAGLHVAHYLLLGGPGETDESLDNTLGRIDKLEKSVLFVFQGMRIYPQTDLYKQAISEGVIGGTMKLLEPVFYRSDTSVPDAGTISEKVRIAASGKRNWIIGSGGQQTGGILSRMYQRGYTGPLWEYLAGR
jgi:radical SAM superfamily enzyme YgiQ (UPF0313 family)